VTEQGRTPAGGYGFGQVVAAAWVPVGGGPPTRPFGYQIFAKAAGETGSVVVGLLAVAAFLAFMVGLVVWSRRRSGRQIEAGKRSGQLSVGMGLDVSCLPGGWATMAQESLNPLLTSGRGRLRVLPVAIAIVPQDGVAGYGGAWMAVLYALWLNVRRPSSWRGGLRSLSSLQRLALRSMRR
jgi:hypothetical protein